MEPKTSTLVKWFVTLTECVLINRYMSKDEEDCSIFVDIENNVNEKKN